MHSKNRHSELVKDPDDFRNYIAFFLDWETETSVTLSLKSFPFKEMFFKVDFILLEKWIWQNILIVAETTNICFKRR